MGPWVELRFFAEAMISITAPRASVWSSDLLGAHRQPFKSGDMGMGQNLLVSILMG